MDPNVAVKPVVLEILILDVMVCHMSVDRGK
jgi:hypothetical protein